MMTLDMSLTAHATGYPANVVSQRYGGHMPTVLLSTDADNGNLIGVGDWNSMDCFKEAAATTFQGTIVQKNVDGTYLVLVTNPGDAYFVYQDPISPYEEKRLSAESVLVNKAGERVRTYELHKLDRIAVSEEGFSGVVAIGAKVTGVEAKKLKIGV